MRHLCKGVLKRSHITSNRGPLVGLRFKRRPWSWLRPLLLLTHLTLKLPSFFQNPSTDPSSPKGLNQVSSWAMSSCSMEKIQFPTNLFFTKVTLKIIPNDFGVPQVTFSNQTVTVNLVPSVWGSLTTRTFFGFSFEGLVGLINAWATLQVGFMFQSFLAKTKRTITKPFNKNSFPFQFLEDILFFQTLENSLTNPFSKFFRVVSRFRRFRTLTLGVRNIWGTLTGKVHSLGKKLVSRHQFPTLRNKVTLTATKIDPTTSNHREKRLNPSNQLLKHGETPSLATLRPFPSDMDTPLNTVVVNQTTRHTAWGLPYVSQRGFVSEDQFFD